MLPLKIAEVIKATNGKLIYGDDEILVSGISSDSRTIKEGELFIPIIGERFDGHDFISEAFKKGASACITNKTIKGTKEKVIVLVNDTTKALGDLAQYYRMKFKIPLVAITGSVGKTTTKDMAASVLGQKLNCLKTQGNFNNEIGLPFTLLNLDNFHEAAVIELGMRGFGEIKRLSMIAQPDIALITNIGISHMERLGSKQNILKAKLEILEGLNEKGILVLNGDDSLLRALDGLTEYDIRFYGIMDKADYNAYDIKSQGERGTVFNTVIEGYEYQVYVPLPGMHNIYNALAAIAVGIELNIPPEAVINGIAEAKASELRLNIMEIGDIKVINDAYNACPDSMKASLDILSEAEGKNKKIAVLGDMLELGENEKNEHVEIGRYAAGKNIDLIVTVGQIALHIARGAVEAGFEKSLVYTFENTDGALLFLYENIEKNDVILIKGSRYMKMEYIIEKLKEKAEENLCG
jgi:UDP-N-acetylmuramoyl-tripeptide--D-alanyl-D-alanine ligase